ncbi:MAG TPA: hypothetical protein VGL59_16360 [Polyangia bacterium]|jgi:hypothetical protein
MRFMGDSGKWGCVVVFTLVGCWSTTALAAKGRVGVRFSGSQAGPARDAIVQVLAQHNFSVVKDQQIEAAASKLHRGLDSAADLAAVAAKLKLTALVAGEVKEGVNKAGVVVRSGSSGKVTAKALWSAEGGPKKLADAIKASAWARLGPGLRAGAGGGGASGGAGSHQSDAAEKLVAAAEQDDEDSDGAGEAEKSAPASRRVVAEEPPAEKPAPAKHSGKSDADLEEEAGISSSSDHSERETPPARHTARAADGDEAVVVARPGRARSSAQNSKLALELGAGPRLLWRDLHYSGATGSALVPFSMAGAPTLGASGAWYPAAHATSGPAGNIGLAGNIEYASGITSKAADGSTFPTATTDFFGGLRVRLPDGPVQLVLTGGYGRHAFVFHNGAQTSRANINVPDMDNRYLRGAADVRLSFTSDLSLTLGAGYRKVIDVGGARFQLKSAQYFPNASVWGMDATVMVGYRFLSVMEAQVGYDLRRYSYTTHAGAGDPIALPSFVDGYSAFWLNLAVAIDGAGSHSKKRSHADDDDEG